MNSPGLEEGQDRPESSLLGTRSIYTYQRPLIKPWRIDSCTRLVLYILVALQIVLLPLGMLYTFAGMESDKTMLSNNPEGHHDHEHEPEPAITSALGLRLSSTTVSATTLSTSSVAIPSASARPDLPKRELTNFVDTFIGVEGYGHCYLRSCTFVNGSIRWINSALRNGEGGDGQLYCLAKSSRVSP